ncbi:hypothetical protein F7984_17765 [Pradoshia sp. D12]|uniref:TcaA second domain-containing protein n=1 Tax=Bacillaceae TaxID=186817 RepID=UPI0011296E86|nr:MULTISPECIES: hypothetical protein [Bacillaceae]QFK72940.1 hypothetical protein F7984_17765 [Pradoshia sp. D12]TPF71932.1 hypothetical protein FHY44_10460 [Bacillus sp. D12]
MANLKISPLFKISLMIILTVLLFVSLYFIKGPFLDKDTLVKKVETALADQNVHQLSRILTSSNEDLVIDEENTKILMDYLQKNPDYTQSLLTVLHEQSRYYDDDSSKTGKEQPRIEGFLTLKKNTNSWLPDNYSIEIDPVYLTITTNSKHATLMVNGEQVIKANEAIYEKKVGPLLPGEYKVEAKLKTNDTDINEKKQVVLWNSDEKINMNLNDEEVGLDTNE